VSADLPEWTSSLVGFDPSRRWWAIACTGNGTHRFEVLAVAYQRDDWPTWHVAGPHIGTSERVDRDGTPNGAIHPDLGVREAGSKPAVCPVCGRTKRLPLVEWAVTIAKLTDHDPAGDDGLPPFLDLSQL
jgi:hypothetical protein